MKKRKKVNKNDHSNLVRLLEHYSPLDRQYFLNKLDKILCSYLNLNQEDLPWINPINNKKNWLKLIRKLRLVVGKMMYENEIQKERTIH